MKVLYSFKPHQSQSKWSTASGLVKGGWWGGSLTKIKIISIKFDRDIKKLLLCLLQPGRSNKTNIQELKNGEIF